MKILFFFVHPSKYYFFKYTINGLKAKGHKVDIAIVTKSVLEDLIRAEGWEYANIFPEGRHAKYLPITLSAAVNFVRTVYRLNRFVKGRQYDLFITDDCLTLVGKLRGVKTLMFLDDDLSVVSEDAILCACAGKIMAPETTDLGPFGEKKISLKSYKELAYLHPTRFTPDKSVISQFNPRGENYAVIRLVSQKTIHDHNGMSNGISDIQLGGIIEKVEKHCRIFISSERELPAQYEKYRIMIEPNKMPHALFYAKLFIGDGQTMASEACILATPAIRFNDLVGRISCMEEKEKKYGLLFGFKINEFDEMLSKIEELLSAPDLKTEWLKRREAMLRDKIDPTDFMISVIENFEVAENKNG